MFEYVKTISQKRLYTWDGFSKRLMFKPLPRPIDGAKLMDITSGAVPELKRKVKSRMRKSCTYGPERSLGLKHPVFT